MSATLDLLDRANDDAESLATFLLGERNTALSTTTEWRWGEHGRLSMAMTGRHKGHWRDWSSDERGDIADLVERERGKGKADAINWLRSEWFGGVAAKPVSHSATSTPAHAREADITAGKQAKIARAGDLWRQAVPFGGTPAEAYLRRRLHGLPIPEPVYSGASLRWHGALRSFQGKPLPNCIGSMVGLITDIANGQPIGLHRTFIGTDGRRIERGALGSSKGVVRLWADEAVTMGLAIGEGVETTLAGHLLFNGPPAWAALNAGNVSSFPVLSGVNALTIYSDCDDTDERGRQAGQQAARACSGRWLAAGKETIVRTPKTLETDFADMLGELIGQGRAA